MRLMVQLVSWSVLCVGCGRPVVAQDSVDVTPPSQAGTWVSERVRLRDGRLLQGLIESEDDAWVNLIPIK